MKTLILSHKHHLAPLAWRLSREGEQVELITCKKRYQGAWAGRLPQAIPPGQPIYPEHPDLKPWVEAASRGEIRIITDYMAALSAFGDSTHLFYTLKTANPSRENYSVVLGAWWTGEEWLLPHWYIPEWGLFPGGLGAEVIAGGTVLRGSSYPLDTLAPLESALQQVNFKGLVGAGLRWVEATGKLEPTGMFTAGWSEWLHWELALGELPSLTTLLGGDPQPTDLAPFTVGVVLSQPPWPIVGTPAPPSVPLELNPEVTRRVFFHDIKVEAGQVMTAGSDGLVGVARGTGRSLARARQVALTVAGLVNFPERQLRMDVGLGVDQAVVALEGLGYW